MKKKKNALFAVITDHAVKLEVPGQLCKVNSDNEMANFQLFCEFQN